MVKTQNSAWPVAGHQKIAELLTGQLDKENVSQAYLFYGPKAIGKATVARYLAADLIGVAADNIFKIHNSQVDYNWVGRLTDDKQKTAKNISIEQIRQLQERLQLSSFGGNYKVAIIDEAETLSPAAANSLLKTLEEPSAKTVLILISTSLKALPATISSRCQLLKFNYVDQDEICRHLKYIHGLDSKKAAKYAELSYGRPGVAINFALDHENYKHYQQSATDFAALWSKNLAERFGYVEQIVKDQTVGVGYYLNIWHKVLRDIMLVQHDLENIAVNNFLGTAISKIAVNSQSTTIMTLIGQVEGAKKDISQNTNPKLTLENLVLNF